MVNLFENNISVLLSNRNGTFQSQTKYLTSKGPASITAGDFNNDAKLDLAVARGVSRAAEPSPPLP